MAFFRRPSCIDEVISASRTYPSKCARPFWLSGRFWGDGDDTRAWLLLIQSVMACTKSPPKAQTSAKESLTLMSQYYERTQADMKPYAKASVFGQKYILLSILGDREQGQSVLNESVTLFRMVLDDEMACLPLFVFLDILLVLFHPLPLWFETTTLQRWKKSVYEGSMGFFDDFVIFLESLPGSSWVSIHAVVVVATGHITPVTRHVAGVLAPHLSGLTGSVRWARTRAYMSH